MEEYVLRFPGVITLKEMTPEPISLVDTVEQNSGQPESGGSEIGNEKRESEKYKEKLKQLTEDQLKIIAAIDSSSTHIDDIIERTGLSAAKVLAQLTLLEIKGFVRREIGKRFSLNL